MKSLSYRPDIDGLRAIAVLSVVLYHAGIGVLSGGYVGVDIFFVISGYLISSIIFHDLEAGKFSLGRFYERRIRRIQPALIAMVLVTMVACAIVFVPIDFKLFAQSVGATVLFSSNIYFYLKSGYFDPLAETKPLLHTWSLAVEEQYYLFFPLLVMLLWRHARRHVVTVLALLAAVSFLFSLWQVRAASNAAFYLPFDRIWELLLGALLATRAVPPARTALMRQALGWLGLAMMLAAVLLYSPHDLFPGERALLPCLGAALLIYAGDGAAGRVQALMSSWPMVFTGKISYSLYLWHWPVLVVLQYLLFRKLNPSEVVLYMVAIYAMAWASWRWIEQPWRDGGKLAISRQQVFGFTAALTVVGMGFAVLVHLGAGLPQRFAPEAQQYAAAAFDTNPLRKACDAPSRKRVAAGELCEIGAPDVPVSFAFIGDSFGDALVPGMDAAARDAGKRGVVLTHSGCFPLLGVEQTDNPSCAGQMDAAVGYVQAHPGIRDVVLVARWTSALLGTRFGQFEQSGWYIKDAQTAEVSYGENRMAFGRGMLRTLHAFNGRQVSVLAFIPEQRYDIPRAMALEHAFGWPRQVNLSRSEHEQRQRALREEFARLEQQTSNGFKLLDVGAQLCDASTCAASRDGTVLYADDNHFSRTGAELLRQLWQQALQPAS